MSSKLQLGITTIGDLLFKSSITYTFGNKSDGKSENPKNIELRIPNYQRPYKWTAKNVTQLLDDIIEAQFQNKENYRVGTLILHENTRNADEGNPYHDIVDGQQRCISFGLLLKALRINLTDTEPPINLFNQQVSANPYNTLNIQQNYWSLVRRINQMDEREVAELGLFIKNQCELIVVITKDLSEAFQFFDSQNARGKKLYPHDLLKAFHLREMQQVDIQETEKTVRIWEEMHQDKLARLFSDYLYRIREWSSGNRAYELDESTIHKFKGLSSTDTYPYAQFYKGAYAFAHDINRSPLPFVTGGKQLNPFQLHAPIVAGKPFFDYTKHYFEILSDIQNNNKYEGYFINGNDIVKTLDLKHYKRGTGNRITRLLFDTVILLYVDRFCPVIPHKNDLKLLDQFVIYAFIWAYSLRAQYLNLGWASAQNYILGNPEITNSYNLYKLVIEADSPLTLFAVLSQKTVGLSKQDIKSSIDTLHKIDDAGIPENYLFHFQKNHFLKA